MHQLIGIMDNLTKNKNKNKKYICFGLKLYNVSPTLTCGSAGFKSGPATNPLELFKTNGFARTFVLEICNDE